MPLSNEQSVVDDLQKLLVQIGASGTDFIDRMEGAKGIGSQKDQETAKSLNELAELVPISPYSGVVLTDVGNKKTLYVNKLPDNDEGTLRKKIQNHSVYQKLHIHEIKFRSYKMSEEGQHTDTAMIFHALEDQENVKRGNGKNANIYLGLKRFDKSEEGAVNNAAPASCTSCASVVTALNNTGHNISVALSTPTNFPSNRNYQIPTDVTKDPLLFGYYLESTKKNLERLENIITDKKEEELYMKFMTHRYESDIRKDGSLDEQKKEQIDKRRRDALAEYKNDTKKTEVERNKFKTSLGDFKTNITKAKDQICKVYQNNIKTQMEEIVKQKEVELLLGNHNQGGSLNAQQESREELQQLQEMINNLTSESNKSVQKEKSSPSADSNTLSSDSDGDRWETGKEREKRKKEEKKQEQAKERKQERDKLKKELDDRKKADLKAAEEKKKAEQDKKRAKRNKQNTAKQNVKNEIHLSEHDEQVVNKLSGTLKKSGMSCSKARTYIPSTHSKQWRARRQMHNRSK